MMSICREFLSNRRQRVVVDGATSEWIPIVSTGPQGSVLYPLPRAPGVIGGQALLHVAALCMLYKVNSNSNHCLFSELPPASVRVRHIRAFAAAHLLEFEVSRCRT